MPTGSTPTPLASVIVVSFNGMRYLEPCLSAIARSTLPRESFETILVDNASTDGSADFVSEAFPWVRIIRNDRNLGFAAGNNAAIRQARGKYVVLLNNDTRVEPSWLQELVRVAASDDSIGACTSKLLFLNNRLTVELISEALHPSDRSSSAEMRDLGVTISDAEVVGLQTGRGVRYLSGVNDEEGAPGREFSWTSRRARLSLEVTDDAQPLRLRLRLGREMPKEMPPRLVRVLANGSECAAFEVSRDSAGEPREIVLEPAVLRAARPIVQNAGTRLLVDGSGQDRGGSSANGRKSREEDEGQYEAVEEVFGFCGASALLRREALEQVGMFDDWFFAYYEDFDLAWRMRLRGWRVCYVPTSVVRHVHCGTSVENSRFFRYHVERNRIAMLLKNAPIRLAISASRGLLGASLGASLNFIGRAVRRDLPGARSAAADMLLHVQVAFAIVGRLPTLLSQRRAIRDRRACNDEQIFGWTMAL